MVKTMKLSIDELKKIIKEQMEEAGGIGGTPAPRGVSSKRPFLILDDDNLILGCILSSSSSSEKIIKEWQRQTASDEPEAASRAHETDMEELKEWIADERRKYNKLDLAISEMEKALGGGRLPGPRAAKKFLGRPRG